MIGQGYSQGEDATTEATQVLLDLLRDHGFTPSAKEVTGDGDGYGDGDGRGDGRGYGIGYGTGDGDGYGTGYGDGDGDGSGGVL
jgi:hypothetical protein